MCFFGAINFTRMTSPTATLLVAVAGECVCVKIAGRANFAVSVDFKRLLVELRARGHRRFILDLSGCLIMDSTFLGVLARQAMDQAKNAPEPCTLELLNPNAKVADLLDNLGVLSLFRVVQSSDPAHLNFENVACAGMETNKLEMSRNCLEAHQTLMALNPENAARFKDVAKFLTEDLKKLETPPN